MSDSVERIYCCDNTKGYNNDALLTSILANQKQGNSPMEMAAVMGNQNNMFNNPWIYFVWMFMMRYMNNGCGDGNGGCHNPQIAALQNQMQDNQNANMIMDGIKGNTAAIGQLSTTLGCDFNTLNQAICAVRGAIDQVSGQVGFSAERVINAVNMGDCRITEAINQCCCNTQKELLRMSGDIRLQNSQMQNSFQLQMCQLGNAVQNGQRDLQVAMDKGFANIAFQNKQDTCDIVKAVYDAQQKNADLLNAHWRSELENKLQDQKFENSQLKQNQYLAQLIAQKGCCNPCNGCGGCGQ